MDLKEIIYKRQSHRDYFQTPVSEETLKKIKEFILTVKPLYSNIKTSSIIVDNENVSRQFGWKAPHYIGIFSEKKEGYRTNVGFIYQQVDLFIQSIGLGSCWFGIGKFTPNDEIRKKIPSDEEFVILIGFGKVKSEVYRDKSGFKRKKLDEISDTEDLNLEVVRIAPSATNSQPWYFTHVDDYYNVYCRKLDAIRRKLLGNFNKIDIGIGLAHLYVSNPETFEFFKMDNPEPLKGYYYVGSFKI